MDSGCQAGAGELRTRLPPRSKRIFVEVATTMKSRGLQHTPQTLGLFQTLKKALSVTNLPDRDLFFL